MERLLIVGCGDIASRALSALAARYELSALARSPENARSLERRGVRAMPGDLDRPETLGPLGAAADRLLHAAPPPQAGDLDLRTRNLIAALSAAAEGRAMVAQRIRRIVYLSTSGVYGDCAGARIDESRPPAPSTARARRRLDAEASLREWCSANGAALVILRVPGIYAADRLPLARLRSRAPALRPEDDVYTNHVHAEDLAAIVASALGRDDAEGTFNANDDTDMKVGDWLDLVADRSGLPRPPRVPREEARRHLSAVQWSFLSESRRLVNTRLKRGLGFRFRYPTVGDGVPVTVAA